MAKPVQGTTPDATGLSRVSSRSSLESPRKQPRTSRTTGQARGMRNWPSQPVSRERQFPRGKPVACSTRVESQALTVYPRTSPVGWALLPVARFWDRPSVFARMLTGTVDSLADSLSRQDAMCDDAEVDRGKLCGRNASQARCWLATATASFPPWGARQVPLPDRSSETRTSQQFPAAIARSAVPSAWTRRCWAPALRFRSRQQ